MPNGKFLGSTVWPGCKSDTNTQEYKQIKEHLRISLKHMDYVLSVISIAAIDNDMLDNNNAVVHNISGFYSDFSSI